MKKFRVTKNVKITKLIFILLLTVGAGHKALCGGGE